MTNTGMPKKNRRGRGTACRRVKTADAKRMKTNAPAASVGDTTRRTPAMAIAVKAAVSAAPATRTGQGPESLAARPPHSQPMPAETANKKTTKGQSPRYSAAATTGTNRHRGQRARAQIAANDETGPHPTVPKRRSRAW